MDAWKRRPLRNYLWPNSALPALHRRRSLIGAVQAANTFSEISQRIRPTGSVRVSLVFFQDREVEVGVFTFSIQSLELVAVLEV